ncbi:MAG: S49 family peptidase [Planctomycetota bacterium]
MTRIDRAFTGWFLAIALAIAPATAWAQAAATTDADAAAAPAEVEEVTWDPTVGWLRLDDALRDGPVPFGWVTEEDAGPSLRGVLSKLDVVAEQDQYLGVVIALDQPALSLTQVTAIGERMLAVREAGKTVICFAEAYDTLTYLLASHADLVVLQRKGSIGLQGLSTEEMYLVGLLEKVGAEADLLQMGRFKGADESLTRSEPSEAWSENIDGLLDDLYGSIVGTIAENRAMTVQELEAAMAASWTLDDAGLLRAGLIDRVSGRDLIEVTEVQFGDGFVWDDAMGESMASARVTNPMALFGMLFREEDPSLTRPTIAVIHATGAIHSGESTIDGGAFSDASIGSKTMLDVLGYARDEDEVKAAVIRLDSPGGSALASEVIWQAVRELSESKPVFISIGGMAASGGYYIASAGDEVYIEPQSIVGSIGVVSGKIVLGGTYEKLGIGVTRRDRGPRAGMFNSVEAFTPEQREVMRDSMRLIYEQFLDRVAIGRGNRLADLEAVDEGMLFTGRQAVENGMADALGGSSAAIVAAAERAGLDEGAYGVIDLPRPMNFQEYLSEMFGGSVRAPGSGSVEALTAVRLARELMGEPAWQRAAQTLDGLMLLRDESVLTLMPTTLIVR